MIIKDIIGMFAFTDDGQRVHVKDIEGRVRHGAVLKPQENGKFLVMGANDNEDCVGGVCPIR